MASQAVLCYIHSQSCWLTVGRERNCGILSRLLEGTMTMSLRGCLGEQAVLREYRGVGQTVSDSRRGQGTRKRFWLGMALRGP